MTAFSALQRPRSLDRVNDAPAWWRRVDVVLLGGALAIALSGVLMIFSATRGNGGAENYTGFAFRQLVWIGLGLVLMTVVAAIDYRKLRTYTPWFYGVVTFILLFVLSPLGSASKGAQAWFQLGPFQLQPSEFSKIAVILALAAYCSRQRDELNGRLVGVVIGIAGIPMALIMLQPDLGTVLVFVAITFVLLVIAGAPGKSLLLLAVMAIIAAVVVIQLGILKQYQLDRLGAFLDPTSNTQQSAYNLNQSKIAIGSGGVFGKGLFLGSQTNLRFVPEQHTDFIFTVVGEELGLVGSGTLLALFAILLWRMWQSAKNAPDRFGTFICAGVLAMFVFQIFENIGMTMGIMPITGIPLPFVSYGGSSTLACFIGLGLVLSVRYRSA